MKTFIFVGLFLLSGIGLLAQTEKSTPIVVYTPPITVRPTPKPNDRMQKTLDRVIQYGIYKQDSQDVRRHSNKV